MGVYLQMRTLDVADYLVGQFALERKTANDFINSLYGGRLFDQARRVSQAYDQYLLIVEGDLQELLSGLKNPRVFWGSLLAIALNFDFRTFFTLDAEQTADLIYTLARRSASRWKLAGPLLVRKPRMATTRDWQLAILESLPTIGPKLAQRLLTSFGSVRSVFRASRAELAVKGGIGEARANRIREVLDAEYRKAGPKQASLD